MARTTCAICACPVAVEADWKKYRAGEGKHLCWTPGDLVCKAAAKARRSTALLRASRRCSDCVHFGAYVEVGGSWNATCLAWHWNGDAEENREPAEILRTAATCDDFEAVDDEREGG